MGNETEKEKIINVGISTSRWEKLKAYADSERRHIRHQAALILEQAIDALGESARADRREVAV